MTKCDLRCLVGLQYGAYVYASLVGLTNTQKPVLHLCEAFFLRRDGKPSFVYLFCPKIDFLDEYTDTHYKMTRILFVYL